MHTRQRLMIIQGTKRQQQQNSSLLLLSHQSKVIIFPYTYQQKNRQTLQDNASNDFSIQCKVRYVHFRQKISMFLGEEYSCIFSNNGNLNFTYKYTIFLFTDNPGQYKTMSLTQATITTVHFMYRLYTAITHSLGILLLIILFP